MLCSAAVPLKYYLHKFLSLSLCKLKMLPTNWLLYLTIAHEPQLGFRLFSFNFLAEMCYISNSLNLRLHRDKVMKHSVIFSGDKQTVQNKMSPP